MIQLVVDYACTGVKECTLADNVDQLVLYPQLVVAPTLSMNHLHILAQ